MKYVKFYKENSEYMLRKGDGIEKVLSFGSISDSCRVAIDIDANLELLQFLPKNINMVRLPVAAAKFIHALPPHIKAINVYGEEPDEIEPEFFAALRTKLNLVSYGLLHAKDPRFLSTALTPTISRVMLMANASAELVAALRHQPNVVHLGIEDSPANVIDAIPLNISQCVLLKSGVCGYLPAHMKTIQFYYLPSVEEIQQIKQQVLEKRLLNLKVVKFSMDIEPNLRQIFIDIMTPISVLTPSTSKMLFNANLYQAKELITAISQQNAKSMAHRDQKDALLNSLSSSSSNGASTDLMNLVVSSLEDRVQEQNLVFEGKKLIDKLHGATAAEDTQKEQLEKKKQIVQTLEIIRHYKRDREAEKLDTQMGNTSSALQNLNVSGSSATGYAMQQNLLNADKEESDEENSQGQPKKRALRRLF